MQPSQPAGQMPASPDPCLLQIEKQSLQGLNDLPELEVGLIHTISGGVQPKSNPLRGTSYLWIFVGGAVRDFQPVWLGTCSEWGWDSGSCWGLLCFLLHVYKGICTERWAGQYPSLQVVRSLPGFHFQTLPTGGWCMIAMSTSLLPSLVPLVPCLPLRVQVWVSVEIIHRL